MRRPDPRELQRVLGGSRVPPALTREDRVRLLAAAGKLLLDSGTESGAFVGGAIAAFLNRGGDLARDFLRVTAKAGSHHTPAVVWQTLREGSSSRGGTDLERASTITPSSPGHKGKP